MLGLYFENLEDLETDFGSSFNYKSITFSDAHHFGLRLTSKTVRRKHAMRFIKEDLQSMCLNVLANHINNYLKKHYDWRGAFGKSHNGHEEFLRRVYSDRLYVMLMDQCGYDTSDIIDMLLSPYWKKVKLLRSDYTYTGLFGRLKVMGKAITSLNLQDSTASSDILTAIICYVPNVLYLNLGGTECSGSTLALISKACKSLVTLNLEECEKVTDEGIAHLFNLDRKEIGFKTLRALNMNTTQVTEKCISLLLKYVTSLEYVSYAVMTLVLYDLYVNEMIAEDDKFNLTSFDHYSDSVDYKLPRYKHVHINDVLETWTVLCPKVTKVFVEGTIDDEFLQLCSRFEHLKIINLMGIEEMSLQFTDSVFFGLRGSQLTEIYVKYVTISVDVIVELCANLKVLTLENVVFEDFDPSIVYSRKAKMNKVESLSLQHMNFKEHVNYKSLVVLLFFSKNLTELSLMFSFNLNEYIAARILNSPYLTTLNLNFTDIKPDELSMFFASETIRSIYVDGCPYIPEKSKSTLTAVNDNPQGNTCAWKIDFDCCYCYSSEDNSLNWAEEITI